MSLPREVKDSYDTTPLKPSDFPDSIEHKLYEEYAKRIQKFTSYSIYADEKFEYFHKETREPFGEIWRKSIIPDVADELVIDLDQLSEMHPNFHIHSVRVSPDSKYLALSLDSTGHESYQLWVKDLTSGDFFLFQAQISGDIEWNSTGTGIFYILAAPKKTMKFYFQLLHPCSEPQLLCEEVNPNFSINLSKSKDQKYIFLTRLSSESSEVYVIDSLSCQNLGVFESCKEGVRYWLDHNALGFIKFMFAFKTQVIIYAGLASEKLDIITCPDRMEFVSMDVYANDILLIARGDRPSYSLYRYSAISHKLEKIAAEHGIFHWTIGEISEPYSNNILAVGTGPAHPATVYSIISGKPKAEYPLEGYVGFDPTLYDTSATQAVSFDGVNVPITLIHRKNLHMNGMNPVYLHVYGAYGVSYPMIFDAAAVPFLERGGVLAYAHVRGGGELGEEWHKAARGTKKYVTILDLKACCEHLKNIQLTSASRLVLHGTSAGGWAVAAYLNIDSLPCLGVVLKRPFIDSLTTLLSPTSQSYLEAEEWGEPFNKNAIDQMTKWSPLQNIALRSYPDAIVFSGLNDERVNPESIRSWCQSIRDAALNVPHIELYEDIETGHLGPTHPDAERAENARAYAFVLEHLFKETI